MSRGSSAQPDSAPSPAPATGVDPALLMSAVTQAFARLASGAVPLAPPQSAPLVQHHLPPPAPSNNRSATSGPASPNAPPRPPCYPDIPPPVAAASPAMPGEWPGPVFPNEFAEEVIVWKGTMNGH